MTSKKPSKVTHKFKTIHSPVFIQFALVMLIVLSIILFTSASFYRSMIENVTAISLQKIINTIKDIDLANPIAVDTIQKIEADEAIIVEIYKRDTPDEPVYGQQVSYSYNNGQIKSAIISTLIDFDYDEFLSSDGIKNYDENCKTGTYINKKTNYSFFVMSCIYPDNPYIYVTGLRSSVIELQARSISMAVTFILLTSFFLVCIISYLFMTRITKPMRGIRDVTKAMVETNDVTLRIPERKYYIQTETDETIESVNHLYENLIITQESLREKTEFLTSQLKEIDAEQKSREEFIAGTSHELKTPISIIQGYAEGAKYLKDDPKALEEYCDTIIEECIRLTDLVVKMISLSEMQNTKTVKFSEFSIRDFIAERIKLHDKTFEKEGITAENLVTDNIYGMGETEKLRFVVNNLFSNAVAYIGGDKIIRIRYEDMGAVYRIFVFNSGEPIESDKLEQMWNAFYRNDPARNRDEGHFGLGLSVVKAVQDAHSQSCGVDNTDGGVEFWFDIPKA